MKPAPLTYRFATTVDEASSTSIAGMQVMAGNQSLGPMLNLRLARPNGVIDLSRVAELRGAQTLSDGSVLWGATVTHAEIEDGEVPDPTGGWLCEVAANIAHRAVRNRGTVGGSLAHADPAADWVLVMSAIGANVHLAGPKGRRAMPVSEFINGPFSTQLDAGEVIVAVQIPKPAANARWAYWKFVRQVGEFAKASAAVFDNGAAGSRCAVGALGTQPLLLDDAAGIVAGARSPAEALHSALPERESASVALHVAALGRALNILNSSEARGAAQ